MYFNYDERINVLCKRIRHDAALDRFFYKKKENQCDEVKHLITFLKFCGSTVENLIRNHLQNLQMAMVVNEYWDLNGSTYVLVSTPFAVILRVTVPKNKQEALVVELERERENGWIYESLHKEGKQYILADCIDERMRDTNLCSIRVFVPVGVMCVPVSVIAQIDESGTFICGNKDILDGIVKWLDEYIHDLYASEVGFQSLNEVEVFSLNQQLKQAVTFGCINRFSVLVDNMYVNENPLHRKSAAFALTMYTILTQLTYKEKDDLVHSIMDKYQGQGKGIVVDFTVDLISKIDSYYDYCDYKYGNHLLETDDMKFIWGIKAYDDLSPGDANLFSMNDIDLIYFKDKEEYCFEWEGIYIFEESKDAIHYYKGLIKAAKKWMISNGYDLENKPEKTPKRPCHTIEGAYWRFHKKMQKEIKEWSK